MAAGDGAGLSSFPDDTLAVLAECLPTVADTLRFGAVCRSWASAAGKRRPDTYVPYLLVPGSGSGDYSDEGNSDRQLCELFCISSKKVYRGLKFPEEARRWHCISSCHAWLAMSDVHAQARLLNPMSGVQVGLPSFTTLPEILDVIEWPPQPQGGEGGTVVPPRDGDDHRRLLYVVDWVDDHDDHVPPELLVSGYKPRGYDMEEMRDQFASKMCMSSSEPLLDPNCIVMMMYEYDDTSKLAYCRPGDGAWTALETPSAFRGLPLGDLIYHRGKFYAAGFLGAVLVVDEDDNGPTGLREVAPPPGPHLTGFKYLVGLLSGELLLVVREVIPDPHIGLYRTDSFQVFKLDDIHNSPIWEEVKSLGNLTLFIGSNCSIVVASSSSRRICGENCIYFVDDGVYRQPYGRHDVAVYDMETKKIKPIYPCDSKGFKPSPTWIMPNNPWHVRHGGQESGSCHKVEVPGGVGCATHIVPPECSLSSRVEARQAIQLNDAE